MHNTEIKPELQNILKKLLKKNKELYNHVLNKIQEITNCSEVGHYKNLRYNMQDSKRVHIGHFVLVFSYDKSKNLISFEYFDHHDNIYKKN